MKKSVGSVLSSLAGAVVGATVGAAAVGKTMGDKVNEWKSMSDKHLALFLMMNQWVKVKQEGKNLAEYFAKNGYKKIAIYGMSYAGESLLEELKDTGIEVAYGIDKNADKIYAEVELVSTGDELEEVDAVVVTPITFFDKVEELLSAKLDCPIISLEDVLYEV